MTDDTHVSRVAKPDKADELPRVVDVLISRWVGESVCNHDDQAARTMLTIRATCEGQGLSFAEVEQIAQGRLKRKRDNIIAGLRTNYGTYDDEF